MPTPTFQPPQGQQSTAQLQDWIIKLVRDLNYLLGNLDTVNVNRLDAKVIIAQTITALQIAANTITADKLSVSQLSAISADMGHITAGDINITTDARIGNILYLKESDISGTKGVVFSTVSGNSAKISVLSGDMSIITDGHITLTIGSSQGLMVNQVVNAIALKSDAITNQSNVPVIFSGTSTSSVAAPDSHNHGFTTSDYIQCYDSLGNPTSKKQFVPYAGSAAHSHVVS